MLLLLLLLSFAVLVSVLNMTLGDPWSWKGHLLSTSATSFRKSRVDPNKHRGLFLTPNFITLQALTDFLLNVRIMKYVLGGSYNTTTIHTHVWLVLTLPSPRIGKPEIVFIPTFSTHPLHLFPGLLLLPGLYLTLSLLLFLQKHLECSLWPQPNQPLNKLWETKELSGQKDFKLNAKSTAPSPSICQSVI